MMRSMHHLVWGGFAVFIACPGAAADVITFDDLLHGEVVANQYVATHGVAITAINVNHGFDLAVGFDSEAINTSDGDLEGPPWSVGNLAPETDLGMLLILAENNIDANLDGRIDDPDDEGQSPAGSMTFDFATAITAFGLDLVDIEGIPMENSWIDFYDGGVHVGNVAYSSFVTFGSAFYDPTIVFGDNSANRITPIAASALGATSFDRVTVNLGGSGGIDNVTFTSVPAPGVLTVLAAGLLAVRRRRRE